MGYFGGGTYAVELVTKVSAAELGAQPFQKSCQRLSSPGKSFMTKSSY